MSLTQCPDCRQLCFLDAASCQGCGRVFRPDVLRARAAAEEQSFRRKAAVLFCAVVAALLAVLLVVAVRGA